MGHRGCRLAVSYPEIADADPRHHGGGHRVSQEKGISIVPEIMIPLIGEVKARVRERRRREGLRRSDG